MTNLKWNLLSKEMRLQIREAMMEEMIRIICDQQPDMNPELVRKKATQAVNQAIWREKAKQSGAVN